eukprot:14326130-Alexandrium_andersonii.AAC.1
MSASLVGSEMCIRDRRSRAGGLTALASGSGEVRAGRSSSKSSRNTLRRGSDGPRSRKRPRP